MVDVTKLLRLKSTARAAADVEPGSGSGATGIVSQYNKIRSQIVDVLSGELREEFEDLFPEMKVPSGGRVTPSGMLAKQDVAHEAIARQRTMVGWLDGVIESQKTS